MDASDDAATALVRRMAAQRPGLFVDFDGTLAPIVDDPAASALPDGAEPVLTTLARHLPVVAVLSGRPAGFLADRVTAEGVRLLGLYGLQEWDGERAVARPEVEGWQGTVDAVKDELAAALAGSPGVVLEDKGLAVALHWRRAPDRDAAQAAVQKLVQEAAQRTGLAREPGKLVEELRPPGGWDKGAAVRSVAGELDLSDVVYIGDDRGDLAAFAAVSELGGTSVAVAAGDETPDVLLEAADVVVDGTPAVHVLLADLASALEASGSR